MTDAKAQLKALDALRPRVRRTRARHARRRLAACARSCRRSRSPTSSPSTSARPFPQADPSMLVPEEGADAGAPEYAWYTLRLAPVVLRALSESSRRCSPTIEMPLVPVLAAMELRGVTVDHAELAAALGRPRASARPHSPQSAYAEIGREVNLGSPKQLQEVLFDQLGMPKTRANEDRLHDRCQRPGRPAGVEPAPVPRLLLEHRDATKLRQIVEIARQGDRRRRPHPHHVRADRRGHGAHVVERPEPAEHPHPHRGGPTHPQAAFRHGPEYAELLTADYSQIEMRIMAHLSGDPGLIEAFNAGEDLHRFVGARVFGVEPADVTPLMRTKVKAMSYGLAYGLSAFGLSKQLRIDRAEAQQLMARLLRAIRRRARLPARRRRAGRRSTATPRPSSAAAGRSPTSRAPTACSARTPSVRRSTRRSRARPPTSSRSRWSASRRTSPSAEPAQSRMLMQVHDELIFEVAPGESDALEAIVRDRHGRTPPTSCVPLDVQIGRGANWDDAAH